MHVFAFKDCERRKQVLTGCIFEDAILIPAAFKCSVYNTALLNASRCL